MAADQPDERCLIQISENEDGLRSFVLSTLKAQDVLKLVQEDDS